MCACEHDEVFWPGDVVGLGFALASVSETKVYWAITLTNLWDEKLRNFIEHMRSCVEHQAPTQEVEKW